MFDNFLAEYKPNRVVSSNPTDSIQFLEAFGGLSFNGGVYRLHASQLRDQWTDLAREAFPDFAARIDCFASDWLGRQFSFDHDRIEQGQPLILLLEPGTGEALEIPVNFVDFHNSELVLESDAALAANGFSEWIANGNPAPHEHQCVGYKKPLFLGGDDGPDNLSIQNMDVYWTVFGQLLAKTRNLPEGTSVGNIRLS